MSEVTDLAQTIREENAETRAQTERIASGEGPYTQEQIEIARKTLKNQDDQRDLTKKMLGISERRMAKAEKLNDQIKAQEQIMAEQKAALEESGVDANNSEKYQKEQAKLEKLKNKKDNIEGAAKKEDENKRKFRETRTGKILGGIKDGIIKMSSSLGGLLKDKAKAGVSSIFGLLKKLALGGLALAAIAFLNNPKFAEMMKFIKDKVIPVIGNFYDKILVPLFNNLKIYFFDVFESLGKFFNDPGLKESMDLLKKGDFFGAFMTFSGTIFKPGGLIDNLATNLVNLFLRIFGLKPIEGKQTVFSMIGKQFTKFYAQFQNTFRQLINDAFEFIGSEKRLDMIDPETGKTIQSDYNKQEEIRKKEIKTRQEESPEIKKLQKESDKLKEMVKLGDPSKLAEFQTALAKVEDAKEEIESTVNKRIALSKDNKKMIDRININLSRGGLRRGLTFEGEVTKQIKKQEKQLAIQQRKLGDNIEAAGSEKRVDTITRLTKSIEDLKRVKAVASVAGAPAIGVNQTNNLKETYTTSPTPMQNPNAVLNMLIGQGGI